MHFELKEFSLNTNVKIGMTLNGGSLLAMPLYLSKIQSGSQAEMAGMREHDIVLKLNDSYCVVCSQSEFVVSARKKSTCKIVVFRVNFPKGIHEKIKLFEEYIAESTSCGVYYAEYMSRVKAKNVKQIRVIQPPPADTNIKRCMSLTSISFESPEANKFNKENYYAFKRSDSVASARSCSSAHLSRCDSLSNISTKSNKSKVYSQIQRGGEIPVQGLANLDVANKNAFCYTAVREYAAQNDAELSISVNDVIRPLKVYSDKWVYGVSRRTGQAGLFPVDHTRAEK